MLDQLVQGIRDLKVIQEAVVSKVVRVELALQDQLVLDIKDHADIEAVKVIKVHLDLLDQLVLTEVQDIKDRLV